AARLARARGIPVTVVDSGEAWAASPASGCVLAPSWLSSLTRAQINVAMDVLEELFTVHALDFRTNLVKARFAARRVETAEVLVEPGVRARVGRGQKGCVERGGGGELGGDGVLVAAGIGAADLVPAPPIRALWGASLRFPDATLPEPRLHMYAPYRQAVSFQMANGGVWFGDGTALVTGTWQREADERAKRTIARAEDLFDLRGPVGRSGARPYVEGHKAGYFYKAAPRVWVSTGGAKNGTVLAAAQAAEFVRALL